MKKLFLFLILVACASSPLNQSKFHHDQGDYEDLILKYTDHKEHIEGLENVFSVQATVLNSQIQQAQINKKAHDYQWSDEQYRKERNNLMDLEQSHAQVFLSFYTSKRKHDDLTLQSSIWKIYLDIDGKRYIGNILKFNGVAEQTKSIYPYYLKFATPYVISFPLATEKIDKSNSSLTITGPLGTETLEFKSL